MAGAAMRGSKLKSWILTKNDTIQGLIDLNEGLVNVLLMILNFYLHMSKYLPHIHSLVNQARLQGGEAEVTI